MSLHEAIFKNDVQLLKTLLDTVDADDKQWYAVDVRGKTPLHLAVALGRFEMIDMLVDKHHPVITCWDKTGWTPLCEAVSYGNVDVINKLWKGRNREIKDTVDETIPKLIENFQTTLGDFYMEIEMEFQSWVPFLTRFCPKDKFKIWKRGTSVRMDHSLIGLEKGSWIYADVSTIFTLDENHGPLLVMMNNDLRVKQQIYPLKRLPQFESQSYSSETQTKLDIIHMMISPSIQTSIDTSAMTIKMYRSISSNISSFFKRRMSDTKTLSENQNSTTFAPDVIGKYIAQRYTICNLNVQTKLRLEHLSQERIDAIGLDAWFFEDSENSGDKKSSKEREKVEMLLKKNIEEAKKSKKDDSYWENIDILQFGLPPPDVPQSSFDEYFNSDVPISVGRPRRVKDHTRALKAKVWLSNEGILENDPELLNRGKVFPWKLSQLLTLLEVLDLGSSGSDSEKSSTIIGQLRSFLRLSGIDNGFPVKLEIPMFGIVRAQVKFSDFVELGSEKATGPLRTASQDVAEQAFEKGFFAVPDDYAVDEVVSHLAKQ